MKTKTALTATMTQHSTMTMTMMVTISICQTASRRDACGRIEGNNPALLRHNNNTTLETLNLSGLGKSTGTAGIIDAGWTATFQLQWDPNSALEKLRLLKNSFVAD
jgi:hypothetical protein